MEDLAVFTALNHSGSFGKKFVKFKKKKNIYIYIYICYLPAKGRSAFSRSRSQFFTIRNDP